jgi:hypothetical protein
MPKVRRKRAPKADCRRALELIALQPATTRPADVVS